jgi:hypothetical protein
MNMRGILFCLGMAVLPAVASGAFDPAAMHQKYAIGATFHTMGLTGAQARNVDGVPGDELLIGYSNMWQVLQWNETAQNFAQVGIFEDSYADAFGVGGNLLSTSFAAFDRDAPVEVAVLAGGGQIGRFGVDGTAHAPVWKVPLQDVRVMLVADLDGQPGDELLLATPTEVSAWKYGANTPLWRIAAPAGGGTQPDRLLLAQLDTDPQLELVFSRGTVVDTKTLQTQWRYPIGFGSVLGSGDLDGDGVAELVACTGRRCDAYDVVHQANRWETFLPDGEGVAAIASADVDDDGRAEIFENSDQHLRRVDGLTGNVTDRSEGRAGSGFLVVGNLRGDCGRELIWGKDVLTTAPDTFHLTDPATMKTFWSSTPQEDGSSGVLVADFSGTGHPSVLWPNRGGSVERFVGFNPPSQSSREVSTNYSGLEWFVASSAAAQLDSDPAVEYVLPVGVNGNNLTIFDGATHAIEWSGKVAPNGDPITSITTGDLNGDGVPDLIVGNSVDSFPSTDPARVVALDGVTRQVLWRTGEALTAVVNDDSCRGCVLEMQVADLKLDGSKEVLVLVPFDALYAVDGKSGAVLWRSTLGRGPASGFNPKSVAWSFAIADVDPSPGAEIIAGLGTGHLAVFDSSGTNLLRDKDLSKFGVATALAVADLDGDGAKEIVAVMSAGGSLLVLSAGALNVLWSGGFLLPVQSLGNQLAIADIDGDSTPEIVTASAYSLVAFEYRSTRPDAAPPIFAAGVLHAQAASGCCSITLEWDPATDAGSMPVHYRIDRSLTPDFTPDSSSRLAETTGNVLVDRSLIQGRTYHYAITAIDSAGRESTQRLRTSAPAPRACPLRRRTAGTP